MAGLVVGSNVLDFISIYHQITFFNKTHGPNNKFMMRQVDFADSFLHQLYRDRCKYKQINSDWRDLGN